eukprot:6206639-Pleurochrysis_carterae.AAC.2
MQGSTEFRGERPGARAETEDCGTRAGEGTNGGGKTPGLEVGCFERAAWSDVSRPCAGLSSKLRRLAQMGAACVGQQALHTLDSSWVD